MTEQNDFGPGVEKDVEKDKDGKVLKFARGIPRDVLLEEANRRGLLVALNPDDRCVTIVMSAGGQLHELGFKAKHALALARELMEVADTIERAEQRGGSEDILAEEWIATLERRHGKGCV